MKVAELDRLAINLNSEFDRDKVEAWEYFCDIAPKLVRRVISAERLYAVLSEPLLYIHNVDGWDERRREALAEYEATK